MDFSIVRKRRQCVLLFDVDETLEISAGPVPVLALKQLRDAGHLVGICGNWAAFVQRVNGWHTLVSIMNVGTPNKETFLTAVRMYVPADDYVFVGNIFGVSGGSDDKGAAERVTQMGYPWRFIKEDAFRVDEFLTKELT